MTEPTRDAFETVTIEGIQIMFKEIFGVSVDRATIYNYQKKKNFPKHLAIGWPRLWSKREVTAWFNEQRRDT